MKPGLMRLRGLIKVISEYADMTKAFNRAQ